MGLAIEKNQYYSPKEYFDISETAEGLYEYEHGKILAMGTTSEPHNDLVFNLTNLFRQKTRGKGCKAHFETIRLEVEPNGLYYLPDVMLCCDERDHKDFKIKRYPILVVEVLSPSSEVRDRGQKFHAYLNLPSLQYYVLVSQERKQIEVFAKMKNGGWAYYRFEEKKDRIQFDQLGIAFTVGEVYDEVQLVEE